MAEFLQEVKSISDSLAVINDKIPDPDIVMYVLNGLGRDYDNFVIFIQNRENPLSFGDLKEKILTHEQWLKAQHVETSVALESVTNSAFFTKKFSPSTSGSSKSASTPEPVKTNDAPFRSNKPPYQWIDFSAVECQICKKKGKHGK